MARAAFVLDHLAAARGILFPWSPVVMACGIALWFGLGWLPGAAEMAGAVAVALAGLAGWRFGPERLHPVAVAVFCLGAGFALAGLRSDRVAGPVLGWRYYGPVEGRIVEIDRSQADRLRLTLDQVVLERVPPDRTPRRVRVALHGAQGYVTLEPGLRVMMTAHLAPPDGPVEPGGFDFQRMAWFRSLGAVGYTRTPVLAQAPPAPGDARVNRLRARISAAVQAAVPGEPGAFAAAILTGDRSGIGQATLQHLRDSNLAHLLAISGLHMGLLTAFVFAALRYGLCLIPRLALRLPVKKVAALVALAAAAFYLALSGGNVATERAFVMVAVMLGAILVDRRALSLRSVAIAALVILALHPESLAEPGFQMSFAATTALVAGFGALRGRASLHRLPGWLRPVVVLVLSSGLAGLATAPVAAAHFNRIADYGLLANVLTVPLMGLVVIPAAVVAGMLAPLGWQAPALWAMEQGTRWILHVSSGVAALDGAVTPVATPAAWVVPAMALGGLWLILWRGWPRWIGVVPLVAGLWVWPGASRPALLVSADGGLLGLLGPEGRALSAPRGNGFAARVWLENDGDPADQATAAARPGFDGPRGARRFAIGGLSGVHLSGKGAAAGLAEACATADLVILATSAPAAAAGGMDAAAGVRSGARPGARGGPAAVATGLATGARDAGRAASGSALRVPGCTVIDQHLLSATGAIALDVVDGTLTIRTSRGAARPWQPQAAPALTDPAQRHLSLAAAAGGAAP